MLGNLWFEDRVKLGFEVFPVSGGAVQFVVNASVSVMANAMVNTMVTVFFWSQLFWVLLLAWKIVLTGIRLL
jgi:hypothetical protein